MKILKKIWMPVLGFFALAWFLLRVIPKPSRASYPCQRAAFPIASAFVLWLIGTIISARAFRWVRRRNNFSFPVKLLFLLLTVLATSVLLAPPSDSRAATEGAASFTPIDDPNTPIGVPRGIMPGRVTWVHNPAAVLFNGSTGKYWEENKVDQQALNEMFSRSLQLLSARNSDVEAWEAAFRYFNQRRGKGDIGYASGEKIAVKLNMNTANGHNDTDAAMNTTPHAVMALAKQLVDVAGVPEQMISFYEVSRPVPNYVYNYVHEAYPGIIFIDSNGGNGRLKYEKDSDCAVEWSCDLTLENGGGHDTFLPKVVSEAAYIINMANLKGHNLAGQSLCAKNHVGTIISENPDQPDLSGPRSAGIHPYIAVHDFDYWDLPMRDMGTYNTLVDLMGHKDLGEKTLLFVIDGLYATQLQHSNVDASMKWTSTPFANQFTSSVFMSFDGVAIESVGLDFTRNESTLTQVYGNVDNYLHEAALAHEPPSGTLYDPEQDGTTLISLGAHEHWNNNTDKKYSSNLGTGTGIELLSYRYGMGGTDKPANLIARKNLNQLQISWQDQSWNESGFQLERKQDRETAFSIIATLPPDRVYYNDMDVTQEGLVLYRVKAKNDDGDSDYSALASANFNVAGINTAPYIVTSIEDYHVQQPGSTETILSDLYAVFEDSEGDLLNFYFESDDPRLIVFVSNSNLKITTEADFAGPARVTVIADDGEFRVETEFTVFNTVGFPISGLASSFLFYPNPAREFILSDEAVNELYIYDNTGSLHLHLNHFMAGEIIDVSAWNEGFYLLKYRVNDRTFNQRLIIQ